ncbi:MAG TPA: response regulator [Thermoanaerobaculia bacterium]|nr:response regulator [Thermoanaerobaculia bacterium]
MIESHQLAPASEDRLLDDLTRVAAWSMRAQAAVLGFFGEKRQTIQSSYHWKIDSLPLESPFSRLLLANQQSILIPDTAMDPEFAGDPLVAQSPRIRFHAAAPIRLGGRVAGALSVFDLRPRSAAESIAPLEALARQAEALLELRHETADLHRALIRAEEGSRVLRELADHARDFFESATDIILSVGSNGAILHANQATADSLGLDPRTLATTRLADLVHPDDRRSFESEMNSILRSGQPGRVETRFLTLPGRSKTYEGNLIPKVIGDEPLLLRAIFRDVTERKLMEIELGQARDAALEAGRLKSQFLTNVTHEVRTPMHVVMGMLDLLGESGLDADQMDLLRTAQGSSQELLTIFQNILHLSALESGNLKPARADFDLQVTLERLAEVMRVAAMERGLDIDLQLGDKVPAVLRGDVVRLRQVLSNLITNAIRFTDKGRVSIRVSRDNETSTHLLIRFEVSDTGKGISETVARTLFQPFVQGDAGMSRSSSGTGVGLAISRDLVHLMQGAIGVESRPEGGSTFWFTLPFEKVLSRDYLVAARKHAFAGLRLLVRDRSTTSLRITTHWLDSWSVRWQAAGSARELLERLESEAALGNPFPVVLYDAHAPDLSGIDLALSIRSNPALASTAVVLMAPLGEQLNDEDLRAAGVTGYIAKPVDQAELFETLLTALGRSDHRAMPERAAATAPTLPSSKPLDPARVRILLAEDKPLNQKLTLNQLARLGYRADVASNGIEVLRALDRDSYDIILMDCQMPVKDGYEATVEIRQREKDGPRTSIIAMTAHTLEGERERCLAAGMDDYLSKPTKQEDLAAALRRWSPREPEA